MARGINARFEKSYTDAADYPCNLCDSATYTSTLFAYKDRLSRVADDLCVLDDTEVKVPFRDLLPTKQDPNILEFKKQNVLSHLALKQWIGDESSVDPLSKARVGSLVTKTDPIVRFIFLHGADSRSPLKLKKEMLLQVLSYHQVMPAFLEFLFLFGRQIRAVDLRYSGFREETCLTTPGPGLDLLTLGRSGKHIEMCYNLKAATEKSPNDWSIRHAAIYHKFDVITGHALWITVKGSLDLKDKIEPVTGKQCRAQDHHFKSVKARFESSLAIHLLVAHWAGESWRWYLQYLEDTVQEETKPALHADREKSAGFNPFTFRDLQKIQTYTEKANETITIIESNIEVLAAIRVYYENLVVNPRFPKSFGAEECVSQLARQLNNIMYDFKMQGARAKLLVQEIESRRDLIKEHLQSQNSHSMEMLTVATYGITKVAQKDAIAIRVITVVALFYLPATFVSSFFSTDVVKYQDPNSYPPNNSTSFSRLAMMRWLQVALPLTALTLILSYLGYLWAKMHVTRRAEYDLVEVV